MRRIQGQDLVVLGVPFGLNLSHPPALFSPTHTQLGRKSAAANRHEHQLNLIYAEGSSRIYHLNRAKTLTVVVLAHT